jgi:hypothetical protein
MICSYGCGKEGIYKLKNGKWCCEKSYNSCPAIRKKNSEITRKTNKFTFSANKIRMNCAWCRIESTLPVIKRHEKHCYLNPSNIKICPVCEKPIKDYKKTKTCSHACSNTYFRTGPDNPNWKEDSSSHNSSYRSTCFFYYDHKCAVCDEKNLVMTHHIDGNRENNKKENLMPLCPTHHYYLHWGLGDLIKDKIEAYLYERIKSDDRN